MRAAPEEEVDESVPPGATMRGLDAETSAFIRPLTPPVRCARSRPPLVRAAYRPPFGLDFLRITSGDCKRCLKTCIGGKIQAAQVTLMKIQAPFSLLTWYLFKNRPFTMIPLEKALGKFFSLPPALFGGAAIGAYLSCRPQCDIDCPYPGGSPPPEELPELEGVNPSDLRFLQRLYQRPAAGGGRGGGGSFSDAVSEMFRVG